METIELLRVPTNATREQIRREYHRLAFRLHPDHGGDPDRFIRLQKEYRQLMAEPGSECRGDDDGRSSGTITHANSEPSRGYTGRFSNECGSGVMRDYIRRLPLRVRAPMPRLIEPPKQPIREYAAAGLLTIVCALLLTAQSLTYTPDAVSSGARFGFCLVLLLLPGVLAAAVGTINRAAGRVLYSKVVMTITLCAFLTNPTWLLPSRLSSAASAPKAQSITSASSNQATNEAPIAFRDVELR